MYGSFDRSRSSEVIAGLNVDWRVVSDDDDDGQRMATVAAAYQSLTKAASSD